MEQLYRIAGLAVRMDTFGRTLKQAEPYLAIDKAANADIVIRADWRSLQSKQPHLSDEDCEYMSTGASFYKQLMDHGGIMLHSSAVVVDGRAYLFSAPCGTGKSTHTKLWLKKFGSRAYILNDDKPALRLENGVWYAYGTPWSGKYDISSNCRAELAGIAVLERGESNKIAPYGGVDAIRSILNQMVRPPDSVSRGKVLELTDELVKKVPIWKLTCNMEPEAAAVAYKGMSGGKEE